ncbi:hypothetical protein VTK26DRAFT_8054 [Humicola hyalothermophila]
MKPTQTPNAKLQLGPSTRLRLLAAYLYTVVATPFMLGHFALDVLLCLPPWTRPTKEWNLNQAVRMRVVRLVLLYWSLLRWGDKLTLRPGRERNRFEVMRPQPASSYKGTLSFSSSSSSAADIAPQPIGTTWTPARPPAPSLVREGLVVALHFHGGGFAIGNGRDADTGYLARALLRHLGCSHVCTPQYRLSSTTAGGAGRFPAPLQDALTAYLWLVREKGIPARQIVVSGDSAGANIAVALLRYLYEEQGQGRGGDGDGDGDGEEEMLPLPGAVALWSPWVDVAAALHLDMRQSPNYRTDYLNKEFGRWGAASVAGHGVVDPAGPYLSPLHHPFGPGRDRNSHQHNHHHHHHHHVSQQRLPPIFVHGGDREVLWDDIKLFAERYGEAGWDVHLHASRHCPHDILLLGDRIGFGKEAEEAVRSARKFFEATTELRLVAVG